MPFGIGSPLDTNGNVAVNLPTDPMLAGNVRVLDSDGNPLDTTENGFLRVSSESLILYDQVDGTAVNPFIWTWSVSTATIVQASGFIGLNAGQSVAANAYAILQSVKSIPLYGTLPFNVEINAKVLNVPQANATMELGIGTASGTSTPTDGAFFRWTTAGQFYAVLNNGGVESTSAQITGPYTDATGESITMPPSPNLIHLYAIEIVEDHVQFSIDDVQVADVQVPTGQAFPFNAGRQAVFARVYNSASTPSTAPQLYIGQVIVNQEDLNQNKPWGDFLVSLGRGGYQSPVTPFAQTANHVNSTSPISATLSNTTPGYTTLGGRFQFAAVAGAATDYLLFAFQVPAGFQFQISDVDISLVNTGAVNSVTVPTIFDWFLVVNSTAASLATSDSFPTTMAYRRVPLGVRSIPTSALMGATCDDIVRQFISRKVCDGGRYVGIGVQIPVGAATVSQIFRGHVRIGGLFE